MVGLSETCEQIHLPRKNVSSTENDINTWLAKIWTVIDRLSVISKSDLPNRIKRSFFQATVVSIRLYGCTSWTLTKRIDKKLHGNCTKVLRTVLNKSRRQHPTKRQLYGHQSPIPKTIQVRRTRHAGHCWRIKDKLISDILLWTPSHGRVKVRRPIRTYLQQFCTDTGCSMEDLPGVMDNSDGWRERVREIYASGMTWWYIYEVLFNPVNQE